MPLQEPLSSFKSVLLEPHLGVILNGLFSVDLLLDGVAAVAIHSKNVGSEVSGDLLLRKVSVFVPGLDGQRVVLTESVL